MYSHNARRVRRGWQETQCRSGPSLPFPSAPRRFWLRLPPGPPARPTAACPPSGAGPTCRPRCPVRPPPAGLACCGRARHHVAAGIQVHIPRGGGRRGFPEVQRPFAAIGPRDTAGSRRRRCCPPRAAPRPAQTARPRPRRRHCRRPAARPAPPAWPRGGPIRPLPAPPPRAARRAPARPARRQLPGARFGVGAGPRRPTVPPAQRRTGGKGHPGGGGPAFLRQGTASFSWC